MVIVTNNTALQQQLDNVCTNRCTANHLSHLILNTHTHTFNGPFSGTTRVGRYQKGTTNLDFTEARDSDCSGISWAIRKSAVCTSLQTDNHASTSPLSFFTGRMPFLPPNQQR